MRPSLFLNTRWSPEVRTFRQPAPSRVLIRSRTLTGTIHLTTITSGRCQWPDPGEVRTVRAVVFVERGSAQPWSFGSGPGAKRVIPTGVFRTSDIEQMRMGVLEHLGIAQAPAWLSAAELREGTVIRLLTPLERTVPILAVRPASRRLSTKVRIFIEHLEKTFALCSQFNPRPS
jgi:hypothetical protein